MKKETVKKFFKFLEKREQRINWRAKFRFSPESLPERLVVDVNLDLSDLPIISLPKGLEARKALQLRRTSIESLPEGLKVGGFLDLSSSLIKSLPEGLEVGGDLYLGGTFIESIPEGLKVGGSLWIRDTPLRREHTEEEIRKMVEDGGGYIKRRIYG